MGFAAAKRTGWRMLWRTPGGGRTGWSGSRSRRGWPGSPPAASGRRSPAAVTSPSWCLRRSCRSSSAAPDRQANPELGAPAQLALHLDPAAVQLGDVFGDGEAEPGPAGLSRSGPVHAIEALEDPREVPGGDPDAGV